jgi:hypothetical protein
LDFVHGLIPLDEFVYLLSRWGAMLSDTSLLAQYSFHHLIPAFVYRLKFLVVSRPMLSDVLAGEDVVQVEPIPLAVSPLFERVKC